MASGFIDGPSASLRPTGIARYLVAAFLLVWLTGWALGETVALVFLVMLIRSVLGSAVGMSWPVPGGDWIAGGAAGFVFLFLLVWLVLWTFGGFFAIKELLRMLAGEDRISVESSGVELLQRAGPFHRLRRFDRSGIRRVRLRAHDKAVMIDTASGSEVVTKYGTADEREAMHDWLRSRLSLPDVAAGIDPMAAPPGWALSVDGGTTRLSNVNANARRIAALIAWAIVTFLGLIWFGSPLSAGSVILLVVTLLIALGAAWLTWSRREWRLRHGELTAHRTFMTWEKERSFRNARLEVAVYTDSDNDHHYTLNVIDAEGKRKIASDMHDDAGIVDLGRWLSARTGFPLTLPRQLQ